MGVACLYFRPCAQHHPAAACLVGILHSLYAIDNGTRREVWRLDVLHQSLGVNLRIVDVCAASVDHLSKVVCRHVGSHTHGDTVAAVHQQVRNLGRHHSGLLERLVEVLHHVHSVLLKVVHYVLAHLRQAALGVTHGSR